MTYAERMQEYKKLAEECAPLTQHKDFAMLFVDYSALYLALVHLVRTMGGTLKIEYTEEELEKAGSLNETGIEPLIDPAHPNTVIYTIT